ncbi:uncharacterized protein [Dermacentor albipictus]|uniref:uncharacterized protein isoform X3 n=1 Tax=Dermacentor albipictus TaxID=60249 RepID=UPI0031FDD4CA
MAAAELGLRVAPSGANEDLLRWPESCGVRCWPAACCCCRRCAPSSPAAPKERRSAACGPCGPWAALWAAVSPNQATTRGRWASSTAAVSAPSTSAEGHSSPTDGCSRRRTASNTEETYRGTSSALETTTRVSWSQMITHNKFDIQTFRNDIALVRLAEPVDLEGSNANLQTVCLPDESMDFSKARCMATGWGETQFKGRHSDVLMEVMLPVWPHDKCVRAYKNYNKITTSMFCAGYVEGKKSSCSICNIPLFCKLKPQTFAEASFHGSTG